MRILDTKLMLVVMAIIALPFFPIVVWDVGGKQAVKLYKELPQDFVSQWKMRQWWYT